MRGATRGTVITEVTTAPGDPVATPRPAPATAPPAAAGGPTEDDPSRWPTGRLLSTAARLVEHAWDAHLATWDLNHASFAVLWVLHPGPASQRELAHRTQVQDQTMSRTLDRLVRSGYVTRERSGADRRRSVVALTPAGRRAAVEAGGTAPAESLLAEAVPGGDLEELRGPLLAVVRHLGRRA